MGHNENEHKSEHGSEKSDHSHHAEIKVYSDVVKEKLAWFYTPYQGKSLYQHLMSRIFPGHHAHAYDITKIDESNYKQQINRIVFAMEKLAALNHHAFTENERRTLTPSRKGLIQKAYLFSLSSISVFWLLHALSTRTFTPKYVGLFVAFNIASNYVLKPMPHYLKEKVRLFRARNLAKKYYAVKKNNFDEFRKILDPKTPLEHLAHLTL